MNLLIILVLAACNYPGLPPAVTNTPATGATAGAPTAGAPIVPVLATATLLLPTNTSEPSATLPPPATPTLVPPPTRLPTDTRSPTRTPVLPASRGKFLGTFTGGKLVLRVNDKGDGIALKELVLTKATCTNGKDVSTRFDYPTAVYAAIEYNQFTISTDNVTVTGYFNNPPTSAAGTVRVQAKGNKGVCVVGPVDWTAVLQ